MDLDTVLGLNPFKTGSLVNLKVQQALSYIATQDYGSLRLKDVALRVGIHPNHLSRLFKKDLGISFRRYILMIRLQKACRLLTESEKSIKQISYEIGFSCPEAFSKTFKRLVGCSPGQYRNSYRQG